MTGADLIVEFLQGQGVSFISTLSGNGLDPLYAACHRAGMRLVDFRNEQAASYCAEAYAKLTRHIGVCAVSSGVAHINAMAGLANAYYDGAPLLLITGASERSHRDAGSFQDIDQVALAAPICKYSRYVDQASRIPYYLHEALSRALLGRPGPVHLTVPVDVLRQETGALEMPEGNIAPPRSAGDPGLIRAAADRLHRAERPLVVAGSGAFYAEASPALDRFARQMQVPVVVPIWDRGTVERSAPYFMGVIGAASGEPPLLPDADLVLLLGAQVDYRMGYLEPPAIAGGAQVVRVDVDPSLLYQGVQPDLAIQGDPASVLEALTDELAARQATPCIRWLAEARRRRQAFGARWSYLPPSPPLTGQHIVQAVRPLLDENTLFLIDGGNIGQWAHMLLADRYPGHWLTCGASGVVGWGIGGAIGAKLAFPERPVLLLSGDGSFGFTPADLETAVRHCTPFTAVVADDRAWGIVASGQRARRSDEPLLACELGPARYDRVAEGFGALGLRVDGAGAILPAVQQGLAARRLAVVHVPIERGGPAN